MSSVTISASIIVASSGYAEDALFAIGLILYK